MTALGDAGAIAVFMVLMIESLAMFTIGEAYYYGSQLFCENSIIGAVAFLVGVCAYQHFRDPPEQFSLWSHFIEIIEKRDTGLLNLVYVNLFFMSGFYIVFHGYWATWSQLAFPLTYQTLYITKLIYHVKCKLRR